MELKFQKDFYIRPGDRLMEVKQIYQKQKFDIQFAEMNPSEWQEWHNKLSERYENFGLELKLQTFVLIIT